MYNIAGIPLIFKLCYGFLSIQVCKDNGLESVTIIDEQRQLFMASSSFIGILSSQLARSVSTISKDCLRELYMFYKKTGM